MDLFSQTKDMPTNLLHRDGIVHYYGTIISRHNANHYLNQLLQIIEWRHDEAVILGKRIITKRKVAWYADKPFAYTYSHTTKTALAWTQELLTLKSLVEKESGETFNSCLLNLYLNGSEGMGWHSDNEADLKYNGAIASLSFGAERKFSLKHKQSKENVSIHLQHGSLLVMKGSTQSHWLHSLPPTKKAFTPRINLTFRSINEKQSS